MMVILIFIALLPIIYFIGFTITIYTYNVTESIIEIEASSVFYQASDKMQPKFCIDIRTIRDIKIIENDKYWPLKNFYLSWIGKCNIFANFNNNYCLIKCPRNAYLLSPVDVNEFIRIINNCRNTLSCSQINPTMNDE